MRLLPRPALPIALTAGLLCALPAAAASLSNLGFVNGIAIPGNTPDLSAGTPTERRVGFFSDLYYDPNRNEWWGLSDRGPGGGLLNYDTRVQRFTVDIAANGAISNFQVAQTVKFTMGSQPLNGLAPSPSNAIGRSFDPEGFVVNPKTGTFLVSDEYGPSLYEFDRNGQFVRAFATPANLLPQAGATTDYNAAPPTLTSGREGNRGFEGLAISPDGRYAYAMLQNGTIQDGYNAGTRGLYTRIVQFDTTTGQPVAQFAYKLESSGQGRGISALVALNDGKLLVLERNNRGLGAGADPTSPDKNVYEIDLAGATDVSGINLPATGNLPAGVNPVTKGAKVMDLDANTLAALGNKSPEKWEGLAIGPQLLNGQYLILAGSDNDYSVTQTGSGEQFDVYFRFTDANPFQGSIQCPIGQTSGCFFTTGGAAASLSSDYALLPGVLHAYTADIAGYTAPIPEPETYALMLGGLALLGWARRRRG